MPNRSSETPDHYAILGVPFGATDEEILAAWRQKIKKWHPDPYKADPVRYKEALEKSFQINAAKDVLLDSEARAKYDPNYVSRYGDRDDVRRWVDEQARRSETEQQEREEQARRERERQARRERERQVRRESVRQARLERQREQAQRERVRQARLKQQREAERREREEQARLEQLREAERRERVQQARLEQQREAERREYTQQERELQARKRAARQRREHEARERERRQWEREQQQQRSPRRQRRAPAANANSSSSSNDDIPVGTCGTLVALVLLVGIIAFFCVPRACGSDPPVPPTPTPSPVPSIDDVPDVPALEDLREAPTPRRVPLPTDTPTAVPAESSILTSSEVVRARQDASATGVAASIGLTTEAGADATATSESAAHHMAATQTADAAYESTAVAATSMAYASSRAAELMTAYASATEAAATRTATMQVRPPPTRAPSQMPTWTPTPLPPLQWGAHKLTSGGFELAYHDGEEKCARPRTLMSNFYFGDVHLDFVVPAAPSWSIGFRYHQASGSGGYSEAVMSSMPDGRILVSHWNYRSDVDPPTVGETEHLSSSHSVLPGATVRFGLTTDENDGTQVNVNGETVVPVSNLDLRPSLGPVDVCTGLQDRRSAGYSIRVQNIRAAWYESVVEVAIHQTRTAPRNPTRTPTATHTATPPPTRRPQATAVPSRTATPTPLPVPEPGNPRMLVSDGDGDLDCSDRPLALATRQGEGEFRFEVPAQPIWSVGVKYDVDVNQLYGMAFLSREIDGQIYLRHWRYRDGGVEMLAEHPIDADDYDIRPEELVHFSWRVNDGGATIGIGGEMLLTEAARMLRPVRSDIALCTDFPLAEPGSHDIEVRDIRWF